MLRILSELYDIIVRESLPNLGPCFSFIPLIAILATFFSPLEPSSPSSRSGFWLWGPFWIQLDHAGPLELDQVNMCAHSTSVQSGRIMLDVVVKKQRDVRVGLDKKILNSFYLKKSVFINFCLDYNFFIPWPPLTSVTLKVSIEKFEKATDLRTSTNCSTTEHLFSHRLQWTSIRS